MSKWDKYKKNKPENNDSNSVNNGMEKANINCLTTAFPILLKKLIK